jgi:hypothetical protein
MMQGLMVARAIIDHFIATSAAMMAINESAEMSYADDPRAA